MHMHMHTHIHVYVPCASQRLAFDAMAFSITPRKLEQLRRACTSLELASPHLHPVPNPNPMTAKSKH